MEEPIDFQDITITFDKIDKDPSHDEKLLYSFILSPTPTDDWRRLFLEQSWPRRQEFAPDIDASFLGANILIIKCYETRIEKDIDDGARQAVSTANMYYRDLVQQINAKRVRDEGEKQRRESERERLIKEKTARLKS